jgi:hypothetical protein
MPFSLIVNVKSIQSFKENKSNKTLSLGHVNVVH